ncbi:aldehyde dehydrogenase family protein [Streptococcus macacae]|uniref:Aldehyde dehydrogenase (NAD) domain protein n=1 Tax=Streptococcus macacae NCTC 11558 TaxID=764298 RepID=G5JXU9_9STRE|nr:aldehyde dehydrogenase family protein [Streptococcus macacae]EHJ52520.1 aldehyde dehydrogenase (NAD) domain protein [Streptococcus macacae NCTC 11558]SUN77656.1 succinylglutamic semialdehyde dehydrogenase [Streptococcus macacae NCTC 11558]
MILTAQEAFNQLKPEAWTQVSIAERLEILEAIKANMRLYGEELGQKEMKMKNNLVGANLYTQTDGMLQTLVAVANVINASSFIYQTLAETGKMPEPAAIRDLGDGTYEIEVFPITPTDKYAAASQHGYLRVDGKPKQVSPLDKPAGVIAVSGAGNYSSSIETIKAIFFDNKTVIHKAHRLNEETDKVWEKIFAPLVERQALSFAGVEYSRDLIQLEGLDAIYFTGSTAVAKNIMASTDTPLISECGGNNPAIIVPGDRKWTAEEIKNQAELIVSISKGNGGAACGRPQTFITSKQWEQREEFLEAIRAAAANTFAVGTYYPKSAEVREAFLNNHPQAEIITAEDDQYPHSDFIFIPDMDKDAYGVKHEAFCQIMGEVALDVPATAEAFLPAATAFANEELLGTLGCMILIDDETKANHEVSFQAALSELNYGGITVNTTPPMVWFNAYLTWGGCKESQDTFVSGFGNFGNALNFENVEKSILVDQFAATGFLYNDRQATDAMNQQIVNFSIGNMG